MQLVVPTGAEKASRTPWVLQDASTGRIFVFSNTHRTAACNCEVSFVASDDDGLTWTGMTAMPQSSGMVGLSQVTGITHSSGRLVGGMRKLCRRECPWASTSYAKAFFSDDHGRTWNTSSWLTAGTTENQVAELSDGRLYMNIRPNQFWRGRRNVRLAAFSSDAGSTWGEVRADPALIDFGMACLGSVVSDPKNKVVYFSHPHARGRSNMTLYRSLDDVQSWRDTVTVYPGKAAYSSSAILDPFPGKAQRVGVFFEADDYRKIIFVPVQYGYVKSFS